MLLNHSVELNSNVSNDVENKFILCAICKQLPLVLKDGLPKELFKHIEEKHLPLNCQKCAKVGWLEVEMDSKTILKHV